MLVQLVDGAWRREGGDGGEQKDGASCLLWARTLIAHIRASVREMLAGQVVHFVSR